MLPRISTRLYSLGTTALVWTLAMSNRGHLDPNPPVFSFVADALFFAACLWLAQKAVRLMILRLGAVRDRRTASGAPSKLRAVVTAGAKF
ncbi:MAG: hypothetical protein ACT4PT_12070 [Methanobacteriota archaeon]